MVDSKPTDGIRYFSLGENTGSEEKVIVENVGHLAIPSIICSDSETLILFSLHDPNKPWYAATDIATVHQEDSQPWELARIADDEIAEFAPQVITVDPDTILAAWEMVSGDISGTTSPDEVAPHIEIVASQFELDTGVWSTPEQLTSNEIVDHAPLPIAYGNIQGILWIQNEGNAMIGDANSGDRLMFTKQSPNGWNEAQTLWSASKGILGFAFVADGLGGGHIVFAVDEDGNLETRIDRELYSITTVNGVWQTATRITDDAVEDANPTLVAPNGVPICVWNAGGALNYTYINDWNPTQVYSEYTIANEASSLDAVTMPGGAAIAYTVQGPNGMDIVASFYDANLDCWSLPRQLTEDEHAESAISLAQDSNGLVIAYLKTQTVRSDVDVEINGEMHHLKNIPQPGRTDLYILRHTLGNDAAVVAESLVVVPENPVPDEIATLRAAIENQGDFPLQNVQVTFYDGDPQNGGIVIGNTQTIGGILIAGEKKEVSVTWQVPSAVESHQIFVVVDPYLTIDDRNRSNNIAYIWTVLPDLAIETCWSSEISSTTVALTARITNKGVIPASSFQVSWRLNAVDGEEIGRSTIDTLGPAGAYEAAYVWEAAGYLNPGQSVQIFVVADSAETIRESDENNNTYSLAVYQRLP